MPTKTKKTAAHTSTETHRHHEKETAMPTTSHSHAHHDTTTTETKETTMTTSSLEAAPVPAPAPVPGAGAATPALAPAPSVNPPPTGASIPAPPAGFTPATPGEFRTVVPRKAELAAMPQALADLSKFTDFDAMFAGIGLTLAEVTQCLLMGSVWSTMRVSTSEWDEYCVLQEGYAWRAIRAALLRLGQAFLLAAQANPKLVAMYPGLSSLLGAKKVIAQKAASTRRLNSAAKAKGEPEVHGGVGKQRQRKAEKAALANGTPATPVAPAAPVQATPVAPVIAPSPASPALANGATNGAAH